MLPFVLHDTQHQNHVIK